MKFISAFHGLDGNFSNDAVILLNQALQVIVAVNVELFKKPYG
jgi:hypothetical protein